MTKTLFRHAPKSSNLTIRLNESERRELDIRAKSEGKSSGVLARELVGRGTFAPSAEHEEVVTRLAHLEEKFTEFSGSFQTLLVRVEVAATASIVSSAMLAETGKATGDAATQIMVTHIEDALDAAPGIIEHRQKGAA